MPILSKNSSNCGDVTLLPGLHHLIEPFLSLKNIPAVTVVGPDVALKPTRGPWDKVTQGHTSSDGRGVDGSPQTAALLCHMLRRPSLPNSQSCIQHPEEVSRIPGTPKYSRKTVA